MLIPRLVWTKSPLRNPTHQAHTVRATQRAGGNRAPCFGLFGVLNRWQAHDGHHNQVRHQPGRLERAPNGQIPTGPTVTLVRHS